MGHIRVGSAIGLAGLATILALCSYSTAAVTYLGQATIAGNGTDLSGLPATLLEDAHSKRNALNGFGSGIAWAGGNTYYLLADRGPNKLNWNAAVDNTTSWANRYQSFQLTVTPSGSSYNVQFSNTGTTLLKNLSGTQYMGISNGAPVGPTVNPRLDSEGIRVAPDGTVWVADEYGPNILHFNAQGQQIGSLPVPASFPIANSAAKGSDEIANNATGRVSNRGAEGLAISPDGHTLVVAMQSALLQDGGNSGVNDRFLVYDLTHPANAPKQYDYPLHSSAGLVSEILAVNNHQFLVDERDGTGGPVGQSGGNGVKKLYLIDLNQPNPITDLTASNYLGTTASNGLPTNSVPNDITALANPLFADIGSILNANAASAFINADGSPNPNGLPDKIEGYAWGPDLPDGRHLLLATNDNDFALPVDSGYRPNYIFAFAVDASDLPGFQAETFAVPEPASLGLLTAGVLALLLRRAAAVR